MRNNLFLIMLISILSILNSCKSDNISGGAKGIIKYGEGDCQLDVSFRYYNNYNGYAYCIDKNIADTAFYQLGNRIYEFSDSCFCANGKYVFALEPGHYYIFLRELPILNAENIITIHYNSSSEKNLFFYKCI
ncbi:MAG: hypothetical protein GX879_04285 [Bacteroidales bacterium]|nr:hypothetical protein [Bacteroidales bacterium]